MKNKHEFTIVNILSIIIISIIVFLITCVVFGSTGMSEQEADMEWCMDRFKDYDYCKDKLGVD